MKHVHTNEANIESHLARTVPKLTNHVAHVARTTRFPDRQVYRGLFQLSSGGSSDGIFLRFAYSILRTILKGGTYELDH